MAFVSHPAIDPFRAARWRKPMVVTAKSGEAEAAAAAPFMVELRRKCATPLPVLQRVADAMASDLGAGLAVEGGGLPMLLSFVDTLPSGNETGLFYALDLGGTNFRVLRVQFGGRYSRVIRAEQEQVSIPQELMSGTTEELFDFIASRLSRFAETEDEKLRLQEGEKREIGFTFSFPVKQTSINSGILIKWTKGFAVSGTTGRDVVACLNEAMERRGLDIRVSALVNDAVSTLAGAHYWDPDVFIAVILGTGTNACYIERVDAIPKLAGQSSASGKTIINTEWGAFSTGLPLTEFDKEMDAASINPGQQLFEKIISGMYLGEIVRRVLLHMAESIGLFGGSVPEKLWEPFSLSSRDLSVMQQDNSHDLRIVENVLQDVTGVQRPSTWAKKTVVEVCGAIVERGGRLAGAGIAGILQKLRQDSESEALGRRIGVAIDGGLYEKYPQYRQSLQDAVSELLGPDTSRDVVIKHMKDGSGTGAALLAATNSIYTN